MEKNFTVNKRGKYYNVIYLGYKTSKYWFDDINMYYDTRDEVETFINYVIEVEPFIINQLEKQNLSFNPKKIIAKYFKVLDGVSSGLDIRSKYTKEEMAELMVNSYNKKYTEAFELYSSTLSDLKENPVHYNKKWRLFDKCTELKKEYELDFEPLEDYMSSTFDKDLDSILEKMDKLLKEINNKNH